MRCKAEFNFDDYVEQETRRVYYDICPLNRKERRTTKGKLLEREARIAALERELELRKNEDSRM